MNVSITVDAHEVTRTLDRAPAQVDHAMRGGMEDATSYLLTIVKRYPSQRNGSTYVRTNTLMRSWSRRIEGAGLSMRGIVGSSAAIAPYNQFVMNRDVQAAVHRGRWSTVQDVVELNRAQVAQFFATRLQSVGR